MNNQLIKNLSIQLTFLLFIITLSLIAFGIKYYISFFDFIMYFISTFLEVLLIGFLSYTLLVYYNESKFIKYCVFYAILLIIIIYVIQAITFYVSGNFLQTIAIENLHEYEYHFSSINKYLILTSSLFVIPVIFIYKLNKILIAKTSINKKILTLSLALFTLFYLSNIKNYAPVLSFITNISTVFFSDIILKDRKLPLEKTLYNKKNKEYPFMKDTVYKNNKYYIKHKQQPNVIIIFMEGISAKFVGCYEDNFENLTSNIDKFANIENVCKFDNYYNHTAATFRGIIGSLSSAYPCHGGFEGGTGWADKDNSNKYKQKKYSSLPKLLNKFKYNTTMFCPHESKHPFCCMAEMLGFNEIFDAQKSCKDILKSTKYFFNSFLSDTGIFLSLKQYLIETETNKTPKFICLYNIGTHAFRDVDKDGKKYALGKNQILNRIYNLDFELGKFLEYFYNSSYANNTYLIITADHCTYFEPAYIELFKNEDIYCFVDKIPLLIYDPFKKLPKKIDTGSRTSLDLAPTVLNLLGIKDVKNSFLGYSLFDFYPYKINIGTYNPLNLNPVCIINKKRYFLRDVPEEFKDEAKSYLDLIQAYQYYEQQNKIFNS